MVLYGRKRKINCINLGRFIPFLSLGGFDPGSHSTGYASITLQWLGFPVPRLELGSRPTKGPYPTTGLHRMGCSFEHYIIGLFRSTVLGPRRGLKRSKHVSSALRWWVVIGWFWSTSSDILLVGTLPLRFNDFYIIVWFRSTSSNRCRHASITLQWLVWYLS